MANTATTLTTQLANDLLTRHSLPVRPSWLNTFLHSTRQPLPPLPALTSTAHFRVLASDITTSLSTTDPSHLLPADINDAGIKERRLRDGGSVPVQVLDVEDIGRSKWSAIEAMERVERGEEVRGREVIRTVPAAVEGDEGSGAASTSGAATTGAASIGGPHKFILQDAAGTKAGAFELGRIPRLGIGEEGVAIGMKLLLKEGTLVRRGVVMLRPEDVVVLGGKVEAWDKAWKEGRKGRLLRDVQRASEEESDGDGERGPRGR